MKVSSSSLFSVSILSKFNVPVISQTFFSLTDDKRTKLRSEAEVSQRPEEEEGGGGSSSQLYYRIEYRTAQDLHPMVRGLWQRCPLNRTIPIPPDKTMSAYMKERVSNELAPGFPESSFNNNNSQPKENYKRPIFGGDGSESVSNLLAGFKDPGPKKKKDEMYKPPPEVRRLGATATVVDPFKPVTHSLPTSMTTTTKPTSLKRPNTFYDGEPVGGSSSTSQPIPSTSRNPPTTAPLRRATTSASSSALASTLNRAPLVGKTDSQNPLQASFDPPPGQELLINRHPLDPVIDHASTTAFELPRNFKPIIWSKGTFKIHLVIDTREGTREFGKRIELCEKMSRDLGIRVEKKMLPLGDMIWVAKKIDPRTGEPPLLDRDGGGGGENDVVLDAIVERKRLDDLESSLKDGRYHSQKVSGGRPSFLSLKGCSSKAHHSCFLGSFEQIRLKDSGISHRIYLVEKYGETNSNSKIKFLFLILSFLPRSLPSSHEDWN